MAYEVWVFLEIVGGDARAEDTARVVFAVGTAGVWTGGSVGVGLTGAGAAYYSSLFGVEGVHSEFQGAGEVRFVSDNRNELFVGSGLVT